MDRAVFWATVAQVVPVLLLVLGVELPIVARLPSPLPIILRILFTITVLGLTYVELRAFDILGGDQEFFNDEDLARDMIGSAVGLIVGLGIAAIWVRRE
jgi:hypothetical protein